MRTSKDEKSSELEKEINFINAYISNIKKHLQTKHESTVASEGPPKEEQPEARPEKMVSLDSGHMSLYPKSSTLANTLP